MGDNVFEGDPASGRHGFCFDQQIILKIKNLIQTKLRYEGLWVFGKLRNRDVDFPVKAAPVPGQTHLNL